MSTATQRQAAHLAVTPHPAKDTQFAAWRLECAALGLQSDMEDLAGAATPYARPDLAEQVRGWNQRLRLIQDEITAARKGLLKGDF